MMLLLDIGNTRIKWARLGPQGLETQQAEAYANWGVTELHERVLLPAGPVTAIWVSNVGGEHIARVLCEAALKSSGATPQFVQSDAQFGKVRNAYARPAQLGADRWLCLIGAQTLTRRSVCIVSVGTAMTVDGMDASGQHLGGLILPGPDLMVSSLMRHTSDLAARAQGGELGAGLFANNTKAAIYQGAVHAAASLVEASIDAMKSRLQEAPMLLLTGGASEHLERLLRTPPQWVPDLVLRGLAAVAKQSGDQAARVSSAPISEGEL